MPTPAFLDTSYVVRYLTGDPPGMAERAAQVIDSDEVLLLSELVLLETAYVLGSFYKMSRPDIVDILTELVQRQNLRPATVSKPRVLQALILCRNSKRNSFADVLIWAQARERDAEGVYSFDRRFPAEGIALHR